ncbi:MAG: hypothetical protein CL393_09230 [Acidiferrobacteraceae bacterium]|nr:hypothetical protein [Acidiferrobacteraceae bacterium]
MAIYRITRFKSLDMDKAIASVNASRDELASVGADFIDITADSEGNGVVIAKYPDEATMEAATATAKKVIGQMIADGLMEGSSIDIWTGDVVSSI